MAEERPRHQNEESGEQEEKEEAHKPEDWASLSKEELLAKLEELEREKLRLISEREQLEAHIVEAYEKITEWERKVRELESRAIELDKRVEAAEVKLVELEQHHLKLALNFKRLRERAEREKREAHLEGALEIVKSLLPVLDNLERAMEVIKGAKEVKALKEGVEMTYKILLQTLERKGLKRIESQGKEFDPEVHECVERIETEEAQERTVIKEELAGYMFRGRLLRAAKVKVAVKPSKEEAHGK